MFPPWAWTALSQAWLLASKTHLPMQACPDPWTLDHSPLFSALGFGGSGSGRHGQGPSQRELRLLPVEQAWNSNLHCKRERGQSVRTQQHSLGSVSGSSAVLAFREQRWRREGPTPSGFLNTNLGLAFHFVFVFVFFQNVPDKFQNTAEALES